MSSPTSGQLRKEVARISDHKLWHPCCSLAPSLTTYTAMQVSRAFAICGKQHIRSNEDHSHRGAPVPSSLLNGSRLQNGRENLTASARQYWMTA